MRNRDWSSDVCSADLLFGYAARGVPYGPDDGTLSPPAVLACLPFTPDLALDALGTMCRRHPEIVNEQGFTSGFNADLRDGDGRVWVSPGLFGLDQGIIVLMIENHRSGLPWRLMRGCRRSEEHTSELQSLMRISYAGFCMKKKTNIKHRCQST